MGKNILFTFSGTGDTAVNFSSDFENQTYHDDTIRIYFNSCQDSAIGSEGSPESGTVPAFGDPALHSG